MKSSNEISVLKARIEKLERAVFGSKGKKIASPLKSDNLGGPKGGTLFLISEGYFNKRRTAQEVMTELEKNDYNYRLQVVRNTLNRLSSMRGPLTRLDVSGNRLYVKRK
ncbi:MAG: hypothetical protein Q8P56_07070 [Candidatus Uhrbacteria bacterium]|nr:hypothetical protein [Candidatus Uhrbacteria bacterium]